MERTFSNINLNDDGCDYSSLSAKDENKKAKNECIKEEFLDELKNIQIKLPNGPLKDKYKSFITSKLKKYDDWTDCIITNQDDIYDSAYDANGYDEYYFGDERYDYDVIGEFFCEEGKYLFINPDAYCLEDGDFADKVGNLYKNPYFRYIDISEYKDLDDRLLIVYADYFIKKYGFSRWFKILSDEQVEFVRKNADKIKLTESQKCIATGTYEKPYNKEANLEKIYSIETSGDLAEEGRYGSDMPFSGFFTNKLSEFDFCNIDVTKLEKDTFWYFVNHFWNLLSRIHDECKSRIVAEFILDNEVYDGDKLKVLDSSTFHRYFDEDDNNWNVEEIKLFCKKLDANCTDDIFTKRIKITKDALSFKRWFEENKADEYRNTFKRIHGTFWNLRDAYQSVKDPSDPKLWIDSSMSRHARII